MSKYTTQLRWLVESYTEEMEGQPITKRIEKALPKIFNFDYPIWDENYRATLEKKIIMRYLMKETCNIVGLWKIYLEERLNSIMPYYNQLYTTTSNKYEWLEDINNTESYEGNKNNNGKIIDNNTGKIIDNGTDKNEQILTESSTQENTTNNKALKSDLPQATIAGDYGTELNEENGTDNLTNTHNLNNSNTINKNNTTDTTNSSNTETENKTTDLFTRTHKGLSGAKSRTQLNIEYRQSLINIDNMIIDELKDLFMLIY